MGSETTLYNDITDLNFEHEGATFIGDSKGNPKVSVIRVASVKQVIQKTCNELIKSNVFEPLTNCDEEQGTTSVFVQGQSEKSITKE